jgi:hypothetical protein
MQFAKLRSGAKYNLASSGIMSYPLKELPVTLEDLEICGSDFYGYAPLRERLAKLNGANRRLRGDGSGHIDGEPSGAGGDAGARRRSAGGVANLRAAGHDAGISGRDACAISIAGWKTDFASIPRKSSGRSRRKPGSSC